MLAIVLALVAAFLFAASNSMQQHSVEVVDETAPQRRRRSSRLLPVTRLLGRLGRSRVWWAGTSANLGGTVTQAAALHFGSLGVVQLVLTTQLIFTLPLGSAWRHQWPGRRDWLAALAVSAGLALFLVVPGATPPEGVPHRFHALLAALSGLALAGLLLVIARGRRRVVHTWLVAAAAGICSATAALLIKLTVADLVDRGLLATVRDWPGYVLAVAMILNFLCEQEAFTGRSLAIAVGVMTITNPAASYVLNDLAFTVHHVFDAPAVLGLAGASVLMIGGVIGLARSPTVGAEMQ